MYFFYDFKIGESIYTKKGPQKYEDLFAEKEGFEPPDLLQSTVFKTAAFDHSAISPLTSFPSLIVVQM